MRVVEEPFITREGILRVLRPMEVTTERPLSTLRRHQAASPGLRVPLRTAGGQLIGRVQLYSSLNTDAARAYRQHQPDLARMLAVRAAKIECSTHAKRLRDAIAQVASTLPVDALSDATPVPLRAFVEARRRTSFRALEPTAFLGEWVAQSKAWLTGDADRLAAAVLELSSAAAKARADLIPDEQRTATTFFGTVERMDDLHAEIDSGNGQTVLVARDRLERAGLATLGRAVAVLEEVGPAGEYSELMPAVSLQLRSAKSRSPYTQALPKEGFIGASPTERDVAWTRRTVARPSPALPVTPLRVA